MIRVIGGLYKGTPLQVPPGPTRPTAGLVREALMSMVSPKIPGARVLDPLAGSGALAIEALSRGAAQALLADRSPRALAALTQNLARLQNSPDPPQAKILQASWPRDFARLTPYGPFDLIFLDPPYEELQLPQIFLSHLHQKSLAAPGAWAVWELAPASLKAWSEGDLAPWRIKTTRIWGQKAVAILFLPDSAT